MFQIVLLTQVNAEGLTSIYKKYNVLWSHPNTDGMVTEEMWPNYVY